MGYDANKKKELFDRLTAASHVTKHHFTEHEKVEGYTREEQGGVDLLLKLETVYGKIQLGYDASKRKSFIFANIKPSIYDTAASLHTRSLSQSGMKSLQKAGTANQAYTAQRKANSTILIYNAERKPWSPMSIRPFLGRMDMEAVSKTMPFVSAMGEKNQLRAANEKDLALKAQLRQAAGNGTEITALHIAQMENLRKQAELNSLIYRKDAMSRLFFNKINAAFDTQKAELFIYYRNAKDNSAVESGNEQAEQETPADDTDDRR